MTSRMWRQIRLMFMAAGCALAASAAPTEEGLVAYYSFDGENPGADAAGHGYDALATGVGLTNGIVGNAALFAGESALIVEALRGFEWGESLTISLWFRRTGRWRDYVPMVNNYAENDPSIQLQGGREEGGGVVWAGVSTYDNPNPDDVGPAPAPQDRWNHVALVYQSGAGYLFVNGQPYPFRRPERGRIIPRTGALMIGSAWWQGTRRQFEGAIDEVRIYKRALTGAELNELSADVASASPIPAEQRSPITRLPEGFAVLVQAVVQAAAPSPGQPAAGQAPSSGGWVAPAQPAAAPQAARPTSAAAPAWWTEQKTAEIASDIGDAELLRTWIRLWREGQKQAVIDDLNRRAAPETP